MATGTLGWDELRKQARHLENDIDLKLVGFSKLGSSHSHHSGSSDTVPLLSDEDVFDNMAAEIEQLLKKLVNINERMSEQPVLGPAMLHTLQRHREILRDYQHEYQRTAENHAARREREDLLRTVRNDSDSSGSTFKGTTGLNRRDMYLKENQHIHNSDRLVNDQINIAIETREHLVSQRQTFKKLQTRFNDISNRFPAFNSLIQRIHFRKRRDSIIVGLVISCCTLLLLLYAFH